MGEACTGYGVSYIAEAPQEFKVGDRVEVVDAHEDLYQLRGEIIDVDNNRVFAVRIDGVNSALGQTVYPFKADQLRKLPDTDNPLDIQVGGSHYKDMAIQPVEFCMKNNLDFCTSSAIKYLCRRKKKNGKEDLLKAKHFIDLLIQLEYPE